MKKEKRFVLVHQESPGFSQQVTIFRDSVTNVQYVYRSEGYGGGLTPLIDAEGKPLLWSGE